MHEEKKIWSSNKTYEYTIIYGKQRLMIAILKRFKVSHSSHYHYIEHEYNNIYITRTEIY